MAAGAPPRDLVVFRLHDELYALPLGSVREIIRYTTPMATAAATGLVQGLINLRGRVLPVADLSPRLGHVLDVTRATRILVLDVDGGELGLLVDTVEGVRSVPAEHVGPLPVATREDALGEEVAAIDDRLIMLLDPERALGGILSRAGARKRASPAPRAPRRRRPAAPPAGGESAP